MPKISVIIPIYNVSDRLDECLESGLDPFEEKRKKICDAYFKYKNTRSTERMAEYLLGI